MSSAREELRQAIADGRVSMDEVRALKQEQRDEELDPTELAAYVARRPGDPVTPPPDPDDPFNLARQLPRSS